MTQFKHSTQSRTARKSGSDPDGEVQDSLDAIFEDLQPSQVRMLIGCMKRVSMSMRNRRQSRNGMLLSGREYEVLVLVSHGYTRREIAQCLQISANTAARHISNIYHKLNISSVAEATTYALQHNLTCTVDLQ